MDSNSQKYDRLNVYLHTIVHELRNPLVAIQGFAGLLSDKFGENLTGEGSNYLKRILANLHRVEGLLSDITKLATVTVEEKDFKLVPVREIIDAGLEAFDGHQRSGVLKVSIQPDLPAIYCDPRAVIQVFANLLSNAIKYARDHHECQVEIGYASNELFHKFYVKDNGVGIRLQDRHKVFRMFSRLQNKKNVSGSGLGLAIVKRIIEGHGGETWVDSRLHQGTAVYFTLPRRGA